MLKINFMPLGSSTLHTIEIGTGGSVQSGEPGTDVPGTGAGDTAGTGDGAGDGAAGVVDGQRDVFTTEMDDDLDVFLPVRTTSGTVRFYNSEDGQAWNTLIDISDGHTPVVLKAGGSPVWKGYVNKGYVGSRPLFGYCEPCEINVQCPLMELDTEYYTPTGNSDGMITLSDVITQIFNNPFGDGNIPFSLSTSVTRATVLGLYVSVGFFLKEFEADDGTVTAVPMYTRKEALEKVLRQACLSAYWNGTTVIISYIEPRSAGTTLRPDPADTGSYETALMPFKKVVVTAEPNDTEDFMQLPTQPMTDWTRTNSINPETDPIIMGGSLFMYKTIARIWGVLNQDVGDTAWRRINDSKYNYDTVGQSGVHVISYQDITGQTVTGYNLVPSVILNYPAGMDFNDTDWRDTMVNTTFIVSTKAPVMAHDALLAIQMRLALDFYDHNWSGQVEISVSIGDLYYDPDSNSWQSTPLFFHVDVENGELKSTHNVSSTYENVTGYCIPVDGTMSGSLKIKVRADDPNCGLTKNVITIEQLKAEVVRHTFDPNEKNTYRSQPAAGRGENDIELAFCSERRTVNADNFLFLPDSTYGYVGVTVMSTGGGTKRPEQWVADTIAEMTTGKVRSLIVLRQDGDFQPGLYSYEEKIYNTLVKKREWGENVTEVHLIEVTP